MKKIRTPILILIAAIVVAGVVYLLVRKPGEITLTGIVTTDEVAVGSEVQGRLEQLDVREGDVVTNGQLLAVVQPREQEAEMAFYASSLKQSSAQVTQAEADVKYLEAQTTNQIAQAEATLASTEAQARQAQADLENATLTFKREEDLYKRGAEAIQSYDQTRTARDAAQARVDSMRKQVEAARAAVAVAQANEQQVASRRAVVAQMLRLQDAAKANKQRAAVRLDYTQVRAPLPGIVDKRAALQGEVVNAGQAIVTLIDQDNLWVRADVEETYIDRIHLGDVLQVKLPSGVTREGKVFYRGVNADFATQRDVSRTKRDIKTFEIRLRCDNHDRSLALGMTAYVTLPLNKS